MGASTLVFIDSIDDDSTCEEVDYEGETLLLCDGVLYRPVYHDDELVYEVVTEPDTSSEDAADAPPPSADENAKVGNDGFRWSD